ncbi:unnamed protein product [Nyctereutes procyonoides]|uniref:40S ribosomal protein S12 n=1 Tax=Nyctereutes procyonoides TaxID=34880 RepID=A0A811YM44_NYCPR|nr:unnamed protein product [Nyctereutes procyonoides]
MKPEPKSVGWIHVRWGKSKLWDVPSPHPPAVIEVDILGAQCQGACKFLHTRSHIFLTKPSEENTAKASDERQAHLFVLASNCDEPMYVKLVEALCAEHQINLIKVDDNKKLGEWVGFCKIDREGKPRKVVGCSCVVVKDYGKESQAKDVIEEYFKCKK